jgi:cleavage and polyadenylation specificity factor subunit 3
MPDEDEQENEQGEDANQDPALIVRVDDADAHINLVTLVHFYPSAQASS